jgi:Iap family predicted aminopeptidase
MTSGLTKILFLLCICGIFVLNTSAQTDDSIATLENIKQDLGRVVCDNAERLEGVKSLFVEKGADRSELIVEEFGNHKNLVISIDGTPNEIIVIGAHYDKADIGCGAIDNWSGIVILANLYRTLKMLETTKTIKFVAFGSEEKGLVGSRMMARAIPKKERQNYCSMVNFEGFGRSFPQALPKRSDKYLIQVAKGLAKELKITFTHARVKGIDADSSSFRKVKIPAITLHGLDNAYRRYLGKETDVFESIKPASVFYGYRFGLAFIYKLDESPCREKNDNR